MREKYDENCQIPHFDHRLLEQEKNAGERPTYTLHPLRGVVWAAFWGTPMAAGIVMAINYARTGNKLAARITVVVGVWATAAIFAMIFAIPDDVLDQIPNSFFYIPQLLIVYLVAKYLQSGLIAVHSANGGVVASAWPSVGIGVLCLPVVLGVIFGLVFLLEPSHGTVVRFGNDEVYYAGDATEEDARKLAGVLHDQEYFGTGGASVRLESASGEHTVSFVLSDNAWDDPEVVEAFMDLGHTLGQTVLSTPFRIQLCDEYFRPKRSLIIQGD